jgi:hypothetical protein
MRDKSVNFVEKAEDPLNMPEIRPIENFWGILEGLVYQNNWQAENLDQLRKRIACCLRKIEFELIQRLAQALYELKSISRLVDNVRRIMECFLVHASWFQ